VKAFGLFISMTIPTMTQHAANNLAALTIWTISKKSDSSTKVHSYKAIGYKSYIIKLMIDLEEGSEESVNFMRDSLFPLVIEFSKNDDLVKFVCNEKNVLYSSNNVSTK
jgi:hypothetical protein